MKAEVNKFNFTIERLTALKPAEIGKRYTVYDLGCTGLCLRVTDKSIKTFCVYKKLNNKPIRVTLGKFPSLKIELARKQATNNINQINEDINPNKVKRDARNEMTLGEIYELYRTQHSEVHNKPLTIKKNKRIWELHLNHWSHKPLSDIEKEEVIKLQLKIKEKDGPFAGNSAVRLLRLLYNQALEREWNGKNPTTGIKFFPEKSRERYILPEEMKRFFKTLESETNPTIKDFIYVALYTGVRKRNIFAMSWDKIDFKSQTWYIPETKNGESQTVVLVDDLIKILIKRKKTSQSEWVFPSDHSKSGHIEEIYKNWQDFLKKAKIKDLRVHDLRRTLGSYQAIAGINAFTIGKSLNHKSLESTKIYARMNLDPVRQAIETATDVMKSFKKDKNNAQPKNNKTSKIC